MRSEEPQQASTRLNSVVSKRDARPVKRLGSLLCVLVCAGVLVAGCAPDSSSGSRPVATEPLAPAAEPSASPDARQPTAMAASPPTTTERPGPLTMLGRTAFESPAPAPSAACHAPEPILADVPRGFEPPGQGPAPSTTLLAPCTTEQTPAAEAGAGHEPSEAVEAPEVPDRQGGVAAFPPIGDGWEVARWTVEIVESVPHDPDAFTQGLEVADGTMYESTGLWGQSSLRTVDTATGEVTARVDLPEEFFGEGLTVVGDEIVQLTWQAGTAIVYDRRTLQPTGEHRYEGEGWGLCLSEDVLIMSDGSDRLTRRDPQTFASFGTVTLTAPDYDGRLDYLNELECVEELVIANVWQTDVLLVIDPGTGRVVAVIDAGPLVDDVSRASSESQIDVLNGVAFDPDTTTLWMTGKLWPRLYRVRVVEVP